MSVKPECVMYDDLSPAVLILLQRCISLCPHNPSPGSKGMGEKLGLWLEGLGGGRND